MEVIDHFTEDVSLEVVHQKYYFISQEMRILFLLYLAENKNAAKYLYLKLSTACSIIRNGGKEEESFIKKLIQTYCTFMRIKS